MSEGESRRADIRRERMRKRRRKAIMMRCIVAFVAVAVIAGIIFLCIKLFSGSSSTESTSSTAIDISTDEGKIEQARILAAGYDYDKAIELLKTIDGYEKDSTVTEAISKYEAERDACVAVDVATVPHVFFHTLIYDFDRCFNNGHTQSLVDGYNAWMITTEEFQKTIEQLYADGYVIINVSDIYTKDASGNYAKNTNLKLPAGKKALVVSYDDTNYYCDYEGWGTADKLVLDSNGNLVNEYTDANGTKSTGSFDHITMLIDFCKEHPDFAYHGHKGTIALTGYNGVLGYRTEPRLYTNATTAEKAWFERHSDITYDNIELYKAEATKVANALKDNGYEFASHTWGHINVKTCSMEALKQDTQWFNNNVQSIVGDIEILIYPHGADIAQTEDYTSSNEKYAYLKSMGYNIYCSIDSTTLTWSQFRSDYIRQARVDIDGYLLYQNMQGKNQALNKLGLDCAAIFDTRRPTPVIIP